MQNSRPRSAKIAEKRVVIPQRRKKNRPISAKKNLISVGSKVAFKPQPDAYLLSRLKPTYIHMDKERLYEDNMALKLALNAFQSENIRIRTKITQLEREIAKKDDLIEEISANEKTPGHKYIHLVNNLKQAIKETKLDLKAKEEEITKLKRNIKSSRISELEVEIQTYVDECTRLTKIAEDLMNKKGDYQTYNNEDTKYYIDTINTLKKDKQDILNNLSKVQDELEKYKLQINSTEKNKKKNGAQLQNQAMKTEIQKLRAQIESSLKETKDAKEKENDLIIENQQIKKNVDEFRIKFETEQKKNKDATKQIEDLKLQLKNLESSSQAKAIEKKVVKKSNPPKLLVKINSIIKNTNQKVSALISDIDKQNAGFIDIEVFIKALKKYGKTLKTKYVIPFTEKKNGREVVVAEKIINMYEAYEYPAKSDMSSSDPENEIIVSTTPSKVPVFTIDNSPIETKIVLIKQEDINEYFQHVSLCMQLHRLQKSELPHTLFGNKIDYNKTLSKPQLMASFRNPPFMFIEKLKIDKFCEFLLQPEDRFADKSKFSMSINDVINKLIKLLPLWEIFESDEESVFDTRLTQVIGKYKKKIKKSCKGFDKNKTGKISIKDFKTAIKDYEILLDSRIFQYMTLLFYSHEYELDKVPYNHFIQAYGEQNNSDSQENYTDEERAQIVNRYLNEIAKCMIRLKVSVREVFQVDQDLIYPESFIAGLEYLGLKNIEHEYVVLILEALQYEHGDEACILMDEFEKIMQNFGVPLKKSDRKGLNSYSSKFSSDSSDDIKKPSIVESENYEYSEDSPEKQGISEISPFGSVSNPGISKQKSFPILKNPKLEKINSEKSSVDSKVSIKIQSSKTKANNYNLEESSDSLKYILSNQKEFSSSSSFNSHKKNQPVIISSEKKKTKDFTTPDPKDQSDRKLSRNSSKKNIKVDDSGLDINPYKKSISSNQYYDEESKFENNRITPSIKDSFHVDEKLEYSDINQSGLSKNSRKQSVQNIDNEVPNLDPYSPLKDSSEYSQNEFNQSVEESLDEDQNDKPTETEKVIPNPHIIDDKRVETGKNSVSPRNIIDNPIETVKNFSSPRSVPEKIPEKVKANQTPRKNIEEKPAEEKPILTYKENIEKISEEEVVITPKNIIEKVPEEKKTEEVLEVKKTNLNPLEVTEKALEEEKKLDSTLQKTPKTPPEEQKVPEKINDKEKKVAEEYESSEYSPENTFTERIVTPAKSLEINKKSPKNSDFGSNYSLEKSESITENYEQSYDSNYSEDESENSRNHQKIPVNNPVPPIELAKSPAEKPQIFSSDSKSKEINNPTASFKGEDPQPSPIIKNDLIESKETDSKVVLNIPETSNQNFSFNDEKKKVSESDQSIEFKTINQVNLPEKSIDESIPSSSLAPVPEDTGKKTNPVVNESEEENEVVENISESYSNDSEIF